MGITRAQYLAPPKDAAEGSPVLIGQVQGVKVDLESGIRILPDGTLRIAPEQINYFVKTNNILAYNSYVWPSVGPPANSVPVADIASNLTFWTIGQDNGPGNPVIGTVYSIDVSGGTTGLIFTGGPVLTEGVITMGGVLAVAHGGTGATNPSDARDNLGAGTVRLVEAGPGLESIPPTGIIVNGELYVPDSGVVPGTYTSATITVDQRGFVTAASLNTPFPIGTQMIFTNPAAPPSFTKNVNLNNYALRVVSGTGGVVGGQIDFTSAFTSYTPSGNVSSNGNVTSAGSISFSLAASGNTQDRSIDVNQMPPHTHTYRERPDDGTQRGNGNGVNNRQDRQTQSTGGGQGHSHPVSLGVGGSINFNGATTPLSISSSFSGNTTSQFAVRYVDCIICTKTSP